MFTIGEFSKIAGMSVKRLRFYHEEGLLVPASVDPRTNYRYYDEQNLKVARDDVVSFVACGASGPGRSQSWQFSPCHLRSWAGDWQMQGNNSRQRVPRAPSQRPVSFWFSKLRT